MAQKREGSKPAANSIENKNRKSADISRKELERIAREQADRKRREEEKKRLTQIILLSVGGTLIIVAIAVAIMAAAGMISIKGSGSGKKTTGGSALTRIGEGIDIDRDWPLTGAEESSEEQENAAQSDAAATEAQNDTDTQAIADAQTATEAQSDTDAQTIADAQTIDPVEDDTYTILHGVRPCVKKGEDGRYEIECDLSRIGDETVCENLFDGEIVLTLTGAGTEDEIYYTLDGSPAAGDTDEEKIRLIEEYMVFKGLEAAEGSSAGAVSGSAVSMRAMRKAERNLYTGPITLEASDDPEHPNVYAVRAQIRHADGTVGSEWIHTFFVGAGVSERYSTAVVSIVGDPVTLTDEPYGVMTGELPKFHGRDSEVGVHVELMAPDGSRIVDQNCGLRLFGGDSRMWAIKSLKLYARKEYSPGKGTFEMGLFDTSRVDKPEKTITKYDKLVIRNGGDDFQRSMIRDELFMSLAKDAGFTDYEAVVPVTVYINGEYYSLEWMHEAYCDEYFKRKYGQSEGRYIDLEGTENYKYINGNSEEEDAAAREYNSMYKSLVYKDLTVEANYEAVCAFADVENYMRYIAFQMFIGNNDWPDNNFRCYRYYAAEGEEYEPGTVRDGRWRYLLHDMDVCFGTYVESGYKHNTLADLLTMDGAKDAGLFRHLMEREDCREYFASYVKYLYENVFTYDRIEAQVSRLDGMRAAELPYYFERLDVMKKEGVPEVFATAGTTSAHVARILVYAKERPEYVRTFVTERLGWPDGQ